MEEPAKSDFKNLLDARELLLAIFSKFHAKQKITFHYVTTHFIIHVIKDGSAYWMLNEGAEKSNDVLKKELKAIGTGPGKQVGRSGRDILGTILQRQRLRHIIKELGWAKADCLPPKAGESTRSAKRTVSTSGIHD